MSAGTLLLAMDTINDMPRFFCLLSLVERAAGRLVVVMDVDPTRKKGAEMAALQFGIPLHDYRQRRAGSALHPHAWKLEVANGLAKPVIWVDLDFGNWQGPSLQPYTDIVTLDWNQARVVGQARKTMEA